MDINLEYKIKGSARGMVLDTKTNEIVYDSDWTDNLILNIGLNEMAKDVDLGGLPYYGYAHGGNTYLAYGSGSNPNSFSSEISGVSASQAGNIISIVDDEGPSSFSLLSQYDVLKYADGTSTFITSANSEYSQFISRKEITTDPQPFTAWKTSRNGLEAEVWRTNVMYDNIRTTDYSQITAGIVSASSRNIFPTNETASSILITEVGIVGFSTYEPACTRLTFDTPIEIEPGQRLILTYKWETAVPALSTVPFESLIDGWNTGGEMGINYTPTNNYGLFGTSFNHHNPAILRCQIINSNEPFVPIIQTPSLSGGVIKHVSNVSESYVDNSFCKIYQYNFDPADSSNFESNDIGGITFCADNAFNTTAYPSYRIRFNEKQSKSLVQFLSITFKKNVSRDI